MLCVATMILFVISSLLLPIIPWIRAILTAWAGEDDDDQDLHRDGDLEHHVVVLNGDTSWMPQRPGVRKRMARRLIGQQPRVRIATNGAEPPFEKGTACDGCTVVLQGRLHVVCGSEEFE